MAYKHSKAFLEFTTRIFLPLDGQELESLLGVENLQALIEKGNLKTNSRVRNGKAKEGKYASEK